MAYISVNKSIKLWRTKDVITVYYKISEIKIWEDDIPSKCLLGKDEEFRLWW